MNGTIFEKIGLDRSIVRWEEYLYELTPVENRGGVFYKREDYFAPLGYGSINGSKLRQCIWLISRYAKEYSNPVGLISGASVKSPQTVMGTAVALHFGLSSCHVIGATKFPAAMKHDNVAMASWLGSEWDVLPVAYNPALQRRVRELLGTPKFKNHFHLEYGITLDPDCHPGSEIEAFHRVGSEQVRNIPDEVETAVIPAGSCNSATSILYGFARFRPKNLREVHLIGIGPSRQEQMKKRLALIEKASGVSTKPFYHLIYHDLHGTGYVDYQDERPFQRDGIVFHPTYEGKVLEYITKEHPGLLNTGSALIWIVGSKPGRDALLRAVPDLGSRSTGLKTSVI